MQKRKGLIADDECSLRYESFKIKLLSIRNESISRPSELKKHTNGVESIPEHVAYEIIYPPPERMYKRQCTLFSYILIIFLEKRKKINV